MKGQSYGDSNFDSANSPEYTSNYNFQILKPKNRESHSSLNESLRVSQMLTMGNTDDLPLALKLLDESLQKSNSNVMEMKENLLYVLKREKDLESAYDSLEEKYKARGDRKKEHKEELRTKIKEH
jgi:hypothetical protein